MWAHSAMTTRVARGKEVRLNCADVVVTKSRSPITTREGAFTRDSCAVKSKPLRFPSIRKSERRTHISRKTSIATPAGFLSGAGGCFAYVKGARARAESAAYARLYSPLC